MVAERFSWSFVLASGESAMIGSAHVGAAAQLGARVLRACRVVASVPRAPPLGGGECGPVGESRSVSAEIVEPLQTRLSEKHTGLLAWLAGYGHYSIDTYLSVKLHL